jgi:hypothetical protein
MELYALIISNIVWMVFFFYTHAQHMRTYQWILGYRPTPPVSPPRTMVFPPAPVEHASEEKGKQISVGAGMGEITP